MPNTHVKLIEKVIVKAIQGKQVGIRRTMDWPGYTGWNAELVYQEEADTLRKEWGIPFSGPGDETFVYDHCIIKKSTNQNRNKKTNKVRIVRNK